MLQAPEKMFHDRQDPSLPANDNTGLYGTVPLPLIRSPLVALVVATVHNAGRWGLILARGKDPLEKGTETHPVFFPVKEFHGQRSPGWVSPWGVTKSQLQFF